MYALRVDDDDVEDESEMDDVEAPPPRSRTSRNQFDDIASIDNELDDRRRKKLILEEAQRKEDEEYEGEWGYSLIKALRGRTVGRRLRRKLFKFGIVEILCGFPLSILAYLESKNFQNTAQFDTEKYGSSLMNITSVVAYPSLIFGIASIAAVRHWATLCTNRTLLGNLMRIYVFAFFLIWVLSLWCICVLFLTFRGVNDWSKTTDLQSMLPYYVCTCIFLLPYFATVTIYTLDVSYLTDEIERGATILEPNPPTYTRDLGDVTLFQSCIYVCGFPLILLVQIMDLCQGVRRSYNRHYRETPPLCPCWRELFLRKKTMPAGSAKSEAAAQSQRRGKTIWHRMYKTCLRCFRGSTPKKSLVSPTAGGDSSSSVKGTAAAAAAAPVAFMGLPLRELDRDRERQVRQQREVQFQEQEAERQRLAIKEAEEAAAFQRRREQEIIEEDHKREEERLLAQQEAERLRQEQEFVSRWQAVLAVSEFKSLWSTLPTSGSFQTGLKAMPTQNALCDHLKKQGFHIVFSVTPSAADLEIGLCNIRPVGEDGWFLARFLANQSGFSAVMKANDAAIVPGLVKKFALAKVLKIAGSK